MAILCDRFEQVNGDLTNVDKKLDKYFEEVENAMGKKKPNGSWTHLRQDYLQKALSLLCNMINEDDIGSHEWKISEKAEQDDFQD